ncbi:hypothetical protein L3X38_007603 [Prunus dulcis]|uniref:Chaperone protein dnaJ-related protein n=1 Tax=Prunus dulcis TaxID=3755 RepID=A0AAD5F6A6_PRUDU|nr:hypothetical protein L3X38_007603 [Prunus dulcis]
MFATLYPKAHTKPNGDDDDFRPLEAQFFTHFATLTLNDTSFGQACTLRTHPTTTTRTRAFSKGDVAVLCEACNGRGWLLCDFCKGQKTNVKSETNRIYRRCPACRAIGQVLCSKCKVFKCVTFPNYDDGEQMSF